MLQMRRNPARSYELEAAPSSGAASTSSARDSSMHQRELGWIQPNRRKAFSPMICVQGVGIDIKAVGSVLKAWEEFRARYSGFSQRRSRIGTDNFDVLTLQRDLVDMSQNEYCLSHGAHLNARSPHIWILLNSDPPPFL